jgi:hypothetical protein
MTTAIDGGLPSWSRLITTMYHCSSIVGYASHYIPIWSQYLYNIFCKYHFKTSGGIFPYYPIIFPLHPHSIPLVSPLCHTSGSVDLQRCWWSAPDLRTESGAWGALPVCNSRERQLKRTVDQTWQRCHVANQLRAWEFSGSFEESGLPTSFLVGYMLVRRGYLQTEASYFFKHGGFTWVCPLLPKVTDNGSSFSKRGVPDHGFQY